MSWSWTRKVISRIPTCIGRSRKAPTFVLSGYQVKHPSVNHVETKKQTPLHYTAMYNALAVGPLLLSNADQTLKDDQDGLLPLDLAILWKNKAALKELDLSVADRR
ncbi:hypothetical protein ABVK25_001318 [Lepraria finkii]|uniref:Uncharacterized protein n=1 Tax=Lepraria finkii TaxID=1340010 RepID=A0ABR4BLJ1_9LECA